MIKRAKIVISEHAKQRIAERMPDISPEHYESLARSAKYKGTAVESLACTNPQLAEFIKRHFHETNSKQLKYYDGCVFVFGKQKTKCLTLITVVNLKDVAV